MVESQDLPFGIKLVSVLLILLGLRSFTLSMQLVQGSPLLKGVLICIGLGSLIAGVGLFQRRKRSWELAQLIISLSIGVEFIRMAQNRGSIVAIALTAMIFGYMFEHRNLFTSSD